MLKDKLSIEIPSYSSCNLDCAYCYIPKNKILTDIDKKWKENDNLFVYLILDRYGEKIENISFWGGEPTFGLKNFDVDSLFLNFKNIKELSTSTNLTVIDNLIYFIKKVDKILNIEQEKSITLNIQISIDGDEQITDKNRGVGVYKKILNNIEKLLIFICENVSDKIVFNINFKSTNTIEDFKMFYESEAKVVEYINSFLYIESLFKEKVRNKKNIMFNCKTLPTLGLPGEYTKDDGIVFYKYLKKFDEVVYKNKIDYIDYDQYYSRFLSILSEIEGLNTKNNGNLFNCSAGNMMMAPDKDGTTHGCHGTFWYNYTDYLKSINENNKEWKEGRRVFYLNDKVIEETIKTITANFRDNLNESRLNYILSSMVNTFSLKLSISFSTIKMLAIAKQISDIYLDNNLAEIASLFINLKNYCWLNNKILNSSLYVNPLSIYRIYLNGALEYFIEKYSYKKNKSRGIKL